MDHLFYDAPFHRFLMLASWATVAAYGSYGEFPRRAGALAMRGPGGLGSPLIRFPTDGSVVPYGGSGWFEIPDPLTSCPGYRRPVGLPITLQVGSGYRGNIQSYSLKGPDGAIETCGFDWLTYYNPDRSVRSSALQGLRVFGGIILIPRRPLRDGHDVVSVAASRDTFTVGIHRSK
jgi:hypothetical protein